MMRMFQIYYLVGLVAFSLPVCFDTKSFIAHARRYVKSKEARELCDSAAMLTVGVMIAALFWPVVLWRISDR